MTSNTDLHQTLEAEYAVIGSVLLDNRVMDELVEMLDPRDFVLETNKLIWQGMLHQYRKNDPIDLVTMVEVLDRYKRLEEVGGVSGLANMQRLVPSTSHAKYYAGIVRSRSYRRRAQEAGSEMIRLATEDTFATDEDFFSEVEKLTARIRPETNGDMKHVSEYRQEYFEHLRKQNDFIYSGFKEFDDWMGGYGRGWLIIKAGRPSVGKTAKALQEVISIGRQHAEFGTGQVCMWSQETKTTGLLDRIMPNMTGISGNRIRRKMLDDLEMKRVEKAYDELEKLPIHFYDAKNVSIEEVRATAKQMKRKHGKLAALVVDYLTIMRISRQKGETRSEAVGYVTRTAKQIALEMDCPFIMLAQLNREGKDEPKLEHLRDSGEIEQDADVVEFLWHNPEDTHKDGKVIQSIIAKGRDVGVNQFRYLFKGWLQQYEQLS